MSFLKISVLLTWCIFLFGNQTVPNSFKREKPLTKRTVNSKRTTDKQLFFRSGTNEAETFKAVHNGYRFDVLNQGNTHLMLKFILNSDMWISPAIVRLPPGTRQSVTINCRTKAKSFVFSYASAFSSRPFTTHSDRYRAYSDGETVMCVPVDTAHYNALQKRTANILNDSKTKVTDPLMPPNTFIYTPGPFYRKAGLFARDFLYQMEGAGRDLVTAEEVKNAVDFLALKQLTANRKVGPFTYPKGAIPDHLYPDGQYCWGPGAFYGDNSAHFHRPSMDEAMCFVTLGWHYGYKAGWNTVWKTWFKIKAPSFVNAWNSVPRNALTGLITQWSTPGHIGANGISETNGACVMWGFHDSYGFGGDDLGTSVLACNAARAMADMYEHSGDMVSAKSWDKIAADMRDAIRARFNPEGYLPWGAGPKAPAMASPDVTGYAVWSGILTDEQADAASDWFASRYQSDKAMGANADLFQMAAPFRGAVRVARKADDISPGRHVWPDMNDGNHWEILAYGYNAYQDGGYWYYMSLGVAVTLWRKHPDLAKEWVENTYTDIAKSDASFPYERIDGMKPVNDRYNASVGPLMGMGMPAAISSVKVKME
jgi:hypothetical protein